MFLSDLCIYADLHCICMGAILCFIGLIPKRVNVLFSGVIINVLIDYNLRQVNISREPS